jgi:ABC-type multidrug transport system fused ATPase/permease subunit
MLFLFADDFLQNATIRENITFGRPFEEERYWKIIRDTCLVDDLELFPQGDLTEVGEKVSFFFVLLLSQAHVIKGISLSGGQKQRINICRAIYRDADIQLFDASHTFWISGYSMLIFFKRTVSPPLTLTSPRKSSLTFC